MKLISWNVNGIRAALNKGFTDFLKNEDMDILCLQETKAEASQVDIDLNGYYGFWNSAEKKGYSGTAIFSKIEPIDVQYGINIPEHDSEGRVITLEFEKFFIVTVYTPNSQRELARLDYRQNKWDIDFLKYVKALEAKKPVIFCGDLNVAHKEIDLANPKNNRRNAGFTDEERDGFDNIIKAGFIDTFREFNTEGGQYTWWTYRMNARARNIGWRIDYFCISSALRPHLEDAFIRSEVMGSDHCPIGIIMNDLV
ncbi:MAG: exodeoxyribonuclease III [Deferribacteres bacterium]|nr:exodeoxyribonuclease III [candidate division KSB1 bacterium]MCB9500369.1 exodeoxyribonuclease III [Deferribacteres bacterium]